MSASPFNRSRRYGCETCGHLYDEMIEGVAWAELPEDWHCPVCGALPWAFVRAEATPVTAEAEPLPAPTTPVGEGWHRVPPADLPAEGRATVVRAGDRLIALVRRDDQFFALDNRCPHQGGPLGEGTLDAGGGLRCPWHGWTFCLRTGRARGGSAVKTYPVRVEGEGVAVQVEHAE